MYAYVTTGVKEMKGMRGSGESDLRPRYYSNKCYITVTDIKISDVVSPPISEAPAHHYAGSCRMLRHVLSLGA